MSEQLVNQGQAMQILGCSLWAFQKYKARLRIPDRQFDTDRRYRWFTLDEVKRIGRCIKSVGRPLGARDRGPRKRRFER